MSAVPQPVPPDPLQSDPLQSDTLTPGVLPAKAQAVLAGAAQVFLEHGFSAATTDMIQRAAGVSKSTVYAHYPNKEALFVAVIERQCALLSRSLSALDVTPDRLPDGLAAVGRTYLDTVLSPSGLALFRVVVAEAPRFPALARTFFQVGPGATLATTRAILARACAAGALDLTAIGLDAAAQAFISLVRGEPQMHYLMHPGARPSPEQVERWVALAVMTFLRAYGRPAERQEPGHPVAP